MAANGHQSYIYVGLAGEGQFVGDGGLYRYAVEDGTWQSIAQGLPPAPQVRALLIHPDNPAVLYAGTQCGVYRSDDSGETWIPIMEGLPADFGFPLVTDPADPDSAFVIPMIGDGDRVTADGKVRVYGTRDAGETWTALAAGLPQENAYLTILRQAFGAEGEGPELGLYFGATSGDVFGSGDGGANWFSVHERLAPVNSVRVA